MKYVSLVRAGIAALLALVSLTVPSVASAQLVSFATQTVDDPPQTSAGAVSAIAVDHQNYPHIIYTDDIDDKLKYAYRDAGGWHIETVLGPGIVGFGVGVSLALDNGDWANISYYTHEDFTTKGDVRWAQRRCDWIIGIKFCWWHHETIAKGVRDPFATGNTSIALTNTGGPHVAFFDHAQGQLVWAKKAQNGTWDLVYMGGVKAGHVSMALSSANVPQFLYSDEDTREVRFARTGCWNNHCGFHHATVDDGIAGSLKLSSTNQPRIAYWKASQVMYGQGVCTGSAPCTWSTTVIDNVGAAAFHPSLALSPGGTPSIAYVRPRSGNLADLVWARRQPLFGWAKQTAYQAAYSFGEVSLALGTDNYPQISHGIAPTLALGWTHAGTIIVLPNPPISAFDVASPVLIDEAGDEVAE